MDTIRVLNGQETLDVLPELCEVLSACVNGGASVGFMLPFSPQDAEPFWRAVAEAAGEGVRSMWWRKWMARWWAPCRWASLPNPTSHIAVI